MKECTEMPKRSRSICVVMAGVPPQCFHRDGYIEGTKMLGCANNLLSVCVSALAGSGAGLEGRGGR